METTGVLEYKFEESPKPPALSGVRDSRFGGTAADCAVLLAATLFPVVLNVRHLGFYADDWGNIGRFLSHGDQTVLDYFHRLYALPGTRCRPLMDLYLAVLFRILGVHPLGYQLVNVLVFFVSAVLFYLSLRLVTRGRFIALTVPLIFALLPNYSSARFVPCTFMIGLSLAFFFLNLYAMLRASDGEKLDAAWTAVSIAAFLVSGLAYETLVPLFALNLVVVLALQFRKPAGHRLPVRSLALLSVGTSLALLFVVVFKLLTATRPHDLASAHLVLLDAILVHFYKLGLRLPIVVTKIIFVYGHPTLLALAGGFGIFLFYYFLRLQHRFNGAATTLTAGLCLIGLGLIIFSAALTIFVAAGGATGFTASGFENRTAVGSSLGVAFLFSGGIVCLTGWAKTDRAFVRPLLIALLCSSELLVTGTIGSFWAEAADRQKLVLDSIKHDIPALPPNTALIVDGVCPYLGPGIVFEGHQDMGGALQSIYRDPSVRGDVVSPRLLVHQDGIETSNYGRHRHFTYGSVWLYDFRARKAWDLHDVNSAVEHFGMMGRAHTFCPEGDEGNGVPIF